MRRLAPLLLLFSGCIQDPGPAPAYPSHIAGHREFDSKPSRNCVFSPDGRYGVVGDGKTVLFLELVRGRVHGSVALPGQVLYLTAHRTANRVYAFTDDSVYCISPGSFTMEAREGVPPGVSAAGFSGGRLFTGHSDGTLTGYNPGTLQQEVSEAWLPSVTHLAGTPLFLVAASGSSLAVLDPADLRILAEYQVWGDVSHLSAAGNQRVSAGVLNGNEVALFNLPGLELELLFTVPGTPLVAAVDPDAEYALAFTDQGMLAAVTGGGRVEWRSEAFGFLTDMVLSPDGWNALLLGRESVFLLEK